MHQHNNIMSLVMMLPKTNVRTNVGHILKRNCRWYNNNNNSKKHLNIKLKTKHVLEKIQNYRKDT